MTEDLIHVVYRAEEFDLGVGGGGAALVYPASESLEQLGEAWFDEGDATGVEPSAFGGCKSGGPFAVAGDGEAVSGSRGSAGIPW